MNSSLREIGAYLEEKKSFCFLMDEIEIEAKLVSKPGEKWRIKFTEVDDPTKEFGYVDFALVAEKIRLAQRAGELEAEAEAEAAATAQAAAEFSLSPYADAARSSLDTQLAEEEAKRDAAENQLAAIRLELEAALGDVARLQAQVADRDAQLAEAEARRDEANDVLHYFQTDPIEEDWEESTRLAEGRLFKAEQDLQEATCDLAHFREAYSNMQVHCSNLVHDLVDARGELNDSKEKLIEILALSALADHPDLADQIRMIINGGVRSSFSQ